MNPTPQPLRRWQRIWVAVALLGLALTWSAPTTLAGFSR